MKRSNRLMLLLGVVLAIVAFGGVLMFGSGPSTAQTPPVETVAVVTAATDIPLGGQVTSDQVALVQLPLAQALDTYRDASDVVGRVARQPITAGTAFASTDFAPTAAEAATQVTQSLTAGHVALAVDVDPLAMVGGLVQPGDYVDVILSVASDDKKFPVTANLPTTGDNGTTTQTTTDATTFVNDTSIKVLVQNVQVLAILSGDATATGTATDANTGQSTTPTSMAVLSLTPQQVEMVRFAQLDGHLTLVLRSTADKDAPDVTTSGVTLRELVDDHGVLPPQPVFITVP